MTVQECYEAIGGNYQEAIGRMMDDARVKRFSGMFLKDTSFQELCTYMDANDVEMAFRAVHTLKGVCANLSLTKLFDTANAMTEVIRKKDMATAQEMFPQLVQDYELVAAKIKELNEEN